MKKSIKIATLSLSMAIAISVTACGTKVRDNTTTEKVKKEVPEKDKDSKEENDKDNLDYLNEDELLKYGGLSVIYEISTPNPTDNEINATLDKLQRRADEYSTEGRVLLQKDNKISVEIPCDTSKQDANEILTSLGEPGILEFLDEDNFEKFTNSENYEVILNGTDIKNAEASSENSGIVMNYIVALQFTDEGTEKFATATEVNIGKLIYIIYDGKVVSSPTVKAAITNGNAWIDGMDNLDEAKQLASTIRIGALPLELNQIEYNIIEPIN